MSVLLTLATVAMLTSTSLDRELPPRVTPIVELAATDRFRHAEVIQIERDFGRRSVNVALDAWMPADDAERIAAVRLWWSDEIDRFPFNDRVRRHVAVHTRRVRPDRWRVSVTGDDQSLAFYVALHRGRPALFADVVVPGGRVVRLCRADSAKLHARRILGIPVGLGAMAVTCTASDGTRHRGTVRTRRVDTRRRR